MSRSCRFTVDGTGEHLVVGRYHPTATTAPALLADTTSFALRELPGAAAFDDARHRIVLGDLVTNTVVAVEAGALAVAAGPTPVKGGPLLLAVAEDGTALVHTYSTGGAYRLDADLHATELMGHFQTVARVVERFVTPTPTGLAEVDPFERTALASPTSFVGAPSTSLDGTVIAMANGPRIDVFDDAGHRLAGPLHVEGGGRVYTATVSPDHRFVMAVPYPVLALTVQGSGTFVRDLPTGALLAHTLTETGPFVQWDPTGERLAIGPNPTTVLDARTGKTLFVLPIGTYVAWSPDRAQLAAAGDAVGLALVDGSTGKVQATIEGFRDPGFLGFSPDRRVLVRIASGAVDLIDLESRARIGRPIPLATGVDTIPAGSKGVLYAGTIAGGPVTLYDLDPASWARQACARAGRNLTHDEWDQYLAPLGPYRATCSQYPAAA